MSKLIPIIHILMMIIFPMINLSILPAQNIHPSQAMDLLMERNYASSALAFSTEYKENPGHKAAALGAGVAFYLAGNMDSAVFYLNQYIETIKDPADKAAAYYNLGNVLYKQNALPEAISAYQDALRETPGDPDIQHNLSLAISKQEQKQEEQEQQKEQEKDDEESDQEQEENEKQDEQDNKQNQEQKELKENEDKQKSSSGDPQEKNDNSKPDTQQQQDQELGKQQKQEDMKQAEIDKLMKAADKQEQKTAIQVMKRRFEGQQKTTGKDW